MNPFSSSYSSSNAEPTEDEGRVRERGGGKSVAVMTEQRIFDHEKLDVYQVVHIVG